MVLVKPTNEHQLELMTWFRNESELRTWAGPEFRYPFTSDSAMSDLDIVI